MCDTVFLRRDGVNFFGKNSDRSPNEAHIMIRCPARDYEDGATLRTTYLTIPQAKHTNACVLLKPHWIWGAEMGWNEHGLHIGNEALFTNVKREKSDGLIGMDLLRLALERTDNALSAAELIISLITEYGQDGNCAFDKKFFYHNGFLIADKDRAFVLETAGRNWVLEEAGDVRTISNCISITDGYVRSGGNVQGNFKKQFENKLFTAVAGAENRRRSTECAISRDGEPVSLILSALRGHKDETVTVNRSSTASPCMHAGNMFGDQTTGSYAAEIGKVSFVTGSSFPCLSVFKPLSPKALVLPENEKAALAYWVRRELVNRHIMSGVSFAVDYLYAGRELEKKYASAALAAGTEDEIEKLSAECFAEEEKLVTDFLSRVKDKPIRIYGSPYFRSYWKKKNKAFSECYDVKQYV
ncbi:MAG: hypothetical protein ACLUE6_04670 [Acutalibacteraceae bacterium]